ncbi:CaiB/BaiF CoA transferase family protein [Rhodovibrionaceae bacterium A322]
MVSTSQKKTPPKGPLSGVKVLDLTSVLMGPYCTQILSDLGADIIKVEGPDGDVTREIGPGKRTGSSGLYHTLNRGKRGLLLDLKTAAGRQALIELSKKVDLFIHSIRRPAMERLGLSYDILSKENPRLVYANLNGFGLSGPYAGQPAYDDVIQGMTGVPLLEARASGNEPRFLANVMADKVSGLTAVYAVMAALYAQATSGIGQEVDVSMFETMSAFMLTEHMTGAVFSPAVSEPVYQRLIAKERRPYQTKDGYVAATIYNNKQWHRFTDLVDQPDLRHDTRFIDIAARLKNVSAYCSLVQDFLKERSTADWLALFREAEIPAAPINSTEDLLTDPHLQAVDFFKKVEHAQDGTLTFPGPPTDFSKTPAAIQGPPPELGEHSEEILREFDLPEDLIRELLSEKVNV